MRASVLSGLVCVAILSTAAAAAEPKPKAGAQAKFASPSVRFQYF